MVDILFLSFVWATLLCGLSNAASDSLFLSKSDQSSDSYRTFTITTCDVYISVKLIAATSSLSTRGFSLISDASSLNTGIASLGSEESLPVSELSLESSATSSTKSDQYLTFTITTCDMYISIKLITAASSLSTKVLSQISDAPSLNTGISSLDIEAILPGTSKINAASSSYNEASSPITAISSSNMDASSLNIEPFSSNIEEDSPITAEVSLSTASSIPGIAVSSPNGALSWQNTTEISSSSALSFLDFTEDSPDSEALPVMTKPSRAILKFPRDTFLEQYNSTTGVALWKVARDVLDKVYGPDSYQQDWAISLVRAVSILAPNDLIIGPYIEQFYAYMTYRLMNPDDLFVKLFNIWYKYSHNKPPPSGMELAARMLS